MLTAAAALLCVAGPLCDADEDEQYKLHYDAGLDPHLEIPNDIVRYATLLLYLSDVDVGGETVMPFADGGLESAGCNDCDVEVCTWLCVFRNDYRKC
jgi:hypothetical protein